MTSLEAYKLLLLKVNKNDSNSNRSLSKGEFVILFNEQQRIWTHLSIKNTTNGIEHQELNNLLVIDQKLEFDKKDFSSYVFKLPSNFEAFESSFSIADKDKCKGRKLTNWLVKPRNISVLLNSDNHNPSFDYEETICLLSNNKFHVFYKDFVVKECYMSFYKAPKNIDIEGYIKVNGSESTNIDPTELNDKQIEEILNRCAIEVEKNYRDIEGLQTKIKTN